MDPNRLDGLDSGERCACLIAERVLQGVEAEAWDVEGRQGAVDAMLTYAPGRRAAFEVTVLAADGALQSEGILHQSDYQWANPGQWSWSIAIAKPEDIPRLRSLYGEIILRCEAAGAVRPEQLQWDLHQRDEDLRWLVEESDSEMHGHPVVAAREGDKVRDVMVTPRGRGGGTDDSLDGLHAALEEAFLRPHMAKHVKKLAAAEADERHLFVPVHMSALPFPVFYGLAFGTQLPREAPPSPAPVTHLWLAPSHSRRVLLYDADNGWKQYEPYNN